MPGVGTEFSHPEFLLEVTSMSYRHPDGLGNVKGVVP